MSEHLSAEVIGRYRQRLMSPPELLAADDHLAVCATCRARAGGAEAVRAAFTAMSDELEAGGGGTDHLSFKLIAAYVDQELSPDEREVAVAHIEACESCAEEVRDLLAFRATIPPQAPPPGAATAPPISNGRAAFLRWPALRTLFRPAVALALALLLLTVLSALLIVSRRSVRRDRDVVANSNNPRPEVTPPARAGEGSTPTEGAHDVGQRPEQASTGGGAERGAEVVVALNDAGGRVTLDGRGRLAGLPALARGPEQDLRRALSTGRAPTPAFIGELIGQPGPLLGGTSPGDSFKLSSPVGTVVRQDRPTLEWQPLDGADSYTVTVSDSDLRPVATSPPLTGTRWAIPRPLARGGTYIWQVSARRGGEEITSPAPPAPEARFKVLGRAGLEELSAAERAGSSSHLLRGVLYARAGLLDEAEREFSALLRDNPHSPVARKLLRNVRQLRRPAR